MRADQVCLPKTTSIMSEREPFNPFYWLLLIVSFLFVITALAVAVVPVLMEKALEAGADVPRHGFHRVLQEHGLWWLLYEVAAIILFGLLSMGLDRLRRLQRERSAATIPPTKDNSDDL